MFRDFVRYSSSTIAAVVGLRVTFPFARELMGILMPPVSGNTQMIDLVNSIICAFVLMAAYLYGSSYRVPFGLAGFVFLIGIACIFGYQFAIAPNQAIISLGVSETVAENFGYQDDVLLFLYFGIFAFLTGGFALILSGMYYLNIRWRFRNS